MKTAAVSESTKNDFGSLVKRLMLEKRLTQAELARQGGTNQPTISAVIRGKLKCGRKLAEKLAKGLGLGEKEKVEFLGAAGKEKWKGIVDSKEAQLVDAIRLAIRENEDLDVAAIESVARPAGLSQEGADFIVILKDGRIIGVDIKTKIMQLKEAVR